MNSSRFNLVITLLSAIVLCAMSVGCTSSGGLRGGCNQANCNLPNGPRPARIWKDKSGYTDGMRDLINTTQYSLFEYRRMFMCGRTPEPHELVGTWRGANKGIVELAGFKQFVKEIRPQSGNILFGTNVDVCQVIPDMVRFNGWQVLRDENCEVSTGTSFMIQPPNGKGCFGHGALFSYRDGNNAKTDAVRLLVDRVVVLDDQHMLGRASAKFGLVEIPLAYFVLERISN